MDNFNIQAALAVTSWRRLPSHDRYRGSVGVGEHEFAMYFRPSIFGSSVYLCIAGTGEEIASTRLNRKDTRRLVAHIESCITKQHDKLLAEFLSTC